MAVHGEKIIGLLSEYVEKNPADLEFYSLLGTMFRESGLALKAAKIHRNILAKPSIKKKFKVKTLAELAKDMFSIGNFEHAQNLVDDVLKIDSKNTDALAIQYELNKSRGAMGKAVEIAEKTLDIDKKVLSSLYTDYARQLIESNDLGKARKTLKKALQNCAENIDAQILQGDLELKAQKYKDAIDSYFKAIEMNQSYTPSILKKIENAFYLSSSYDDFSTRMREELEYKNDNPDLHTGLGKFLKKRLLAEEAKDEFKKALEFNPTHLKARDELIETLLDEKNIPALKEELSELFSEIYKNMYYFCTKCSNRDKTPSWKCPVCGSFDTYEKMVFLF